MLLNTFAITLPFAALCLLVFVGKSYAKGKRLTQGLPVTVLAALTAAALACCSGMSSALISFRKLTEQRQMYQPFVFLSRSTDDKLEIKNVGLGPALLIRVNAVTVAGLQRQAFWPSLAAGESRTFGPNDVSQGSISFMNEVDTYHCLYFRGNPLDYAFVDEPAYEQRACAANPDAEVRRTSENSWWRKLTFLEENVL